MRKQINKYKTYLFAFGILILLSCNQSSKSRQQNLNEVIAKDFLINLSQSEFDSALVQMDPYLIERADKSKLDISIQKLSEKIISDFGNSPKISFISSEKTIHEGFEASFLIYKIESKQRFGYYFFYLNDQTTKILLVSEFAMAKEKRW